MLVEQGAPLSMVLRFVLYVLPFSLMFTLPWGFLTAVLLVYGRLSSDNELTAMRMSGRSLWRIGLPVLLLGGLFCGFSYWLNTEVAPTAKLKIAELLFATASKDPNALLREGQLQTRFSGQRMLIEKREGDRLLGFHLYQNESDQQPGMTVHAKEVKLDLESDAKMLRLTLFDAVIETETDSGERQLAMIDEMPWQLDLSKVGQAKEKPNRFTNRQIREKLKQGDLDVNLRKAYELEHKKRFSFSFACLALGVVGIPLGVRHSRKETSAGFGVGLGIALGYFILLELADSLASKQIALADLILWMPNMVALGIGLLLFYRVTRA